MLKKERCDKIKLFAMDVDGVLTNGCMYYSENGDIQKKYNTHDGMGIELLRNENIIPVIITKEKCNTVLKRAEKLKVKEVYTGVDNKLEIITQLLGKYDLKLENVAYIGDDINDIPVLSKVGLSFAPHNAVDIVKQNVTYVLSTKGGEGAVRDAIEFILSQKKLNSSSAKLIKNTPKIVNKPWGREVWIIENEKYSGKILEINKDMQSSLHYHAKKTETMYVLEGILKITSPDGSVLIVNSGEYITLYPGDIHRLFAIEDLKLVEISTPHLGDVFRVEDDYDRAK